MSDGNFNRALLPHTPYASGLKAGKAMAKMKAVEAFDEWLHTQMPQLSEAQRVSFREAFAVLLSHKVV